MTRVIKNLKNLLAGKTVLVAAAMGALMVPAIASAGDRYDRGERYDYRHDHHNDAHFNLNFLFGSAPVYETRIERVWVPAVYRTVRDRVWVAPVTRDVRDRVWIEPVYGWREVVFYDRGRRHVERERYVIRPGHYEDVLRQVVVTPGHWRDVERQELVTAGHWQERPVQVRVNNQPRWAVGFGF
jgi:hypothetical protein